MTTVPSDVGRRALVLGGGGVAGIAWMTGVLAGAAAEGVDLAAVDLVIGTSAGATVAAQIGSGLPLDELVRRQTEPELQAREIPAEIDLQKLMAEMAEIAAGSTSAEDARARVGAIALAATTVPESERRWVIESRLPAADWPRTPTVLVAVDAVSGEARMFDRDSGVGLVDAVAASCAVPGVWPPVTIGERRYVDGGVRSAENADLAAGCGRVVVLSPLGIAAQGPGPLALGAAVEQLRADGAEVLVIEPDELSLAAIGPNPLAPGTRGPAARAGREQGCREDPDCVDCGDCGHRAP